MMFQGRELLYQHYITCVGIFHFFLLSWLCQRYSILYMKFYSTSKSNGSHLWKSTEDKNKHTFKPCLEYDVIIILKSVFEENILSQLSSSEVERQNLPIAQC